MDSRTETCALCMTEAEALAYALKIAESQDRELGRG